jgi:hypothetical protein
MNSLRFTPEHVSQPLKVIIVASPESGDGKTSVAKSDHKGIGHSRHCRGGESHLFLQGFCHFGSLIDLAQLIAPRSILGEVLLHVMHEIPHAFAPVVASDLVV